MLTSKLDRCANGGFFELCDGFKEAKGVDGQEASIDGQEDVEESKELVFEVVRYRKVKKDDTDTARRRSIEIPQARRPKATTTFELKRDWRDWLFAGPGLWWLWLFFPFVGFAMVTRGLYVSASRSFAPVHFILKSFWTIWLVATAIAVYFQLSS